MPTERFFHLPEEKRQRITNAARKEFSRVPFDGVSINQIIQSADIPRGSFYQYFSDKLDLLSYLMSDSVREIEQVVRHTLETTDGHPCTVFGAIFDAAVQMGFREENIFLFQNVIPHLKLEESREMFPYLQISDLLGGVSPPENDIPQQTCRQCLSLWLSRGIPEQSLLNLLELLLAALRYTMAQLFFHPEQRAEIQQNFKSKLVMLRHSLESEERNHVKI
jgi:AcrR family transcriptional regulator